MENRLKIAYLLSTIAFFITYAVGGRSIVLAIAFFVSLAFSYMKSIRGRLVWLGIIAYLTYGSIQLVIFTGIEYKFYLLVCIVLLAISIANTVKSLNIHEIASHFSEKAPVKATTIFFLFNILLISCEVPLFFLLGLHHYFRTDPNAFIISILQLFIDTVIINSLFGIVSFKLLKARDSAFVFSLILLVMNCFLWFSGIRFKSYLYDFAFELAKKKVIGGLYLYKFYLVPLILSIVLSFLFIASLKEE